MKRLGDFYEWMGEKRKGTRRLHTLFFLIIAVELVLLGGCLVYFALQQMWTIIATAIGPLGGLLMTTALVYSNLRQSPALRFIGFSIEPETIPETMDRWEYLEDEYLGTSNVRDPTRTPAFMQLHEVRPQQVKRFPYAVYEVRFKKMPPKLRVANDLTNIGSLETNIHEYTVEERAEKNPASLGRYPREKKIELQKRETLNHIFPTDGDLHEGFYQLEIKAIAATRQVSQSCWVWVSQDRKTIRWCNRKRPLKKCEKLKIKEA